MGIRESINNNRWIGVAIAAIIFATAGVIVAYTFWPTQPSVHPDQAFYTDDDGKTFFRDSVYRFPPFDHDGKTANGAVVYSYSKGSFVAIQFRYTPQTKKLLEDTYVKAQSGGDLADVRHLLARSDVSMAGCEIKTAGSDHWASRAANPYPRIAPPDGGDCLMVNP